MLNGGDGLEVVMQAVNWSSYLRRPYFSDADYVIAIALHLT